LYRRYCKERANLFITIIFRKHPAGKPCYYHYFFVYDFAFADGIAFAMAFVGTSEYLCLHGYKMPFAWGLMAV
jgi:hypothetical protein